jgi:Zn-dependent peptidase ImmA (M78 family)
MGADGVSNPFVVRNSIERSCNKFAAEFLAPIKSFSQLVEQQEKGTHAEPARLIRQVSSASLLSLHATAIRLVEAGYLTQLQLRTWEKVRRKAPREEKDEETEAASASGGGNPHAKRISELGYLPTYLAKLAIDKKIIDSVDVQAGLSLSEGLQTRAFDLAARRMEVALSA